MRPSMHLGGHRPLRIREAPEPLLEEEVFNPEGAATDGNPFPEPLQSEEVPVEVDAPDYSSMTVEELRALLRAQELPVSGTKAELVARLSEPEAPSPEAAEGADAVPSPEAAVSDEPQEQVSENNADSGPEQPDGEQHSD